MPNRAGPDGRGATAVAEPQRYRAIEAWSRVWPPRYCSAHSASIAKWTERTVEQQLRNPPASRTSRHVSEENPEPPSAYGICVCQRSGQTENRPVSPWLIPTIVEPSARYTGPTRWWPSCACICTLCGAIESVLYDRNRRKRSSVVAAWAMLYS